MATYSNNTTIKFLSGVTLNGNGSYTVPANCYAVLSLTKVVGEVTGPYGTGGWGYLAVDGIIVLGTNSNSSYSYIETAAIYVPAGKVISVASAGKNGSAYTLITLFTNTP